MSRHFIGLDVGGTKVSTARLRDGMLGEPLIAPVDKGSPEAILDQLVSCVELAREPDTAAVGIGVPSVVEWATGRVRSSVNIPLADVPLRAVLRERTGLPVYVDNDATCAALAEAHDDAGRLVARNLVMLTVGTGVGGGIVLDGRIYRGATGAAPELGHMVVGLDLERGVPEPLERWPQPGTLEALAAGTALDRLASASEGRATTGAEVVEAAEEGDEDALALLTLLGQRLGIGIANVINTFDPEEVVIGGGVSAAGELLIEPARQAAWKYVLPGVGTTTAIRRARHGRRAGVMGAALLAEQETLQRGAAA